MIKKNILNQSFLAFLFLVSLFCIVFFYAMALPGYFLFDDWPNLYGLSLITDFWSGLSFVTSGIAGPSGRPIALATFAFQADAWDTNPGAMLKVNIAIHLIAVFGAFFLAAGLARLHISNNLLPWWIALVVAVLWGLSPFLATTHLMVIQRMTSLSGLFVLWGLAAFVWAHLLDCHRFYLKWSLLVYGLGIGTLMAVFSKENGALLPLLALIIIWLWIPKNHYLHDKFSRVLLLLLLIFPTILLLFYLACRIPGILDNSYGPRRYFTPVERLLTQPVVLLDYLRYLLFPKPVAVSPFVDHWPASTSWLNPPITLIAALFWSALFFLAIWLRRWAPYFVFGLAFFLAAHILESSFIGLELYFAHRNYIPAFGLYFALVFAAFSVPLAFRRLAIIGLVLYCSLFATVLWQVTSHWNEKHVNAELWLSYNPYSVRGAQFLANQYLDQDDAYGAYKIIERAIEKHPYNALLHIQLTNNCIDQEENFLIDLQKAVDVLSTTKLYHPQAAMELLRLSQDPNHSPLCKFRDFYSLEALANALLDNQLYKNQRITRARLYLAKAFINAELSWLSEAIDYFVEAFRTAPDIDVAFYGMSLMANTGDYIRVYDFLMEVREAAPNSRLGRELWLNRLEGFEVIIRESERIDRERMETEAAVSG